MTCPSQSPSPSQPSATSRNSIRAAYAEWWQALVLVRHYEMISAGFATHIGSGSRAPKPCSQGTCERF